MKTVLLGASGFLGRNLVRRLGGAGHECDVLTRDAARRRDVKLFPGVRLLATDVYDPAALARRLEGADAAVSMAGMLNERGLGGAGFRRVHVELVAALLAACRDAGVGRLLHVSAINAGRGDSHYLRSKAEAEVLLRDSGLEVTVFRPSVIFGPGDSFFNRFARLLRLTPFLPLACPGSRLQPVYVDDVAVAMSRALSDPASNGETFELGGPRIYTLRELVRWTADTLGLKRTIVGLPDPVSRLQGAMLDFVPGKPFSSDNYKSLQLDNVTERNDWPRFGMQPASIEAMVPEYLGESARQRRLDRSRRRLEH